jgi:hypothetical protein
MTSINDKKLPRIFLQNLYKKLLWSLTGQHQMILKINIETRLARLDSPGSIWLNRPRFELVTLELKKNPVSNGGRSNSRLLGNS